MQFRDWAHCNFLCCLLSIVEFMVILPGWVTEVAIFWLARNRNPTSNDWQRGAKIDILFLLQGAKTAVNPQPQAWHVISFGLGLPLPCGDPSARSEDADSWNSGKKPSQRETHEFCECCVIHSTAHEFSLDIPALTDSRKLWPTYV